MDKFEYNVCTIDYYGERNNPTPDYSGNLKTMGERGWELVGVSSFEYQVRGYFKRKLTEDKK